MMVDNTCPWCGAFLEDLWELFMGDHPDAVLAKCHRCGKPIRIQADIEFSISKGKEADDAR